MKSPRRSWRWIVEYFRRKLIDAVLVPPGGSAGAQRRASTVARRCKRNVVRAPLLAALSFVACAEPPSERPTRAECERFREHAIELRVLEADGPGIPAEAVARHRRQLAEAAGPALIEQCERDFTRKRLECSLAATTHDSINACAEERASK